MGASTRVREEGGSRGVKKRGRAVTVLCKGEQEEGVGESRKVGGGGEEGSDRGRKWQGW